MAMQTQDPQSAEEEIFALRKKIDLYMRVGDMSEISRLQLQILQLQQQHGAVKGAVRKKDNDSTY
jgi:hypothetical protein